MHLKKFLDNRRRWEVLAVVLLLLLFSAINATTEIIDNYREGRALDVDGALARELTSAFSIGILIPVIVYFLHWVNLSFANLRWRVLWLVPGFIAFTLLHVVMMLLFRSWIWAAMGEMYVYGSLALNLLYEVRKDLLTFIGIVAVIYSYEFILDRLQGEAKFLAGSDQTPDEAAYKQQFLVKMLNSEYLVRVADIESINSASNYVLLNCGARSYPMRQTMTALTEQLDPALFMRVHRTVIVNLDQVTALSESGEPQVKLASGGSAPVSKTYLPALREALQTRAA